ncbi:MAG: DUF4230 domain-containing protein [bacterium]|nr:DUF4230 domain-containing protein [bacterium]
MKYIKPIAYLILIAALTIFIYKFFFAESFSLKVSETSVVSELRALSRLETAQFTIEKVIDAGTDGGAFTQFLFGDRILLIAHGTIIAGFNLENLTDNAVVIAGQDIEITLPAPEILLAMLDNSQTRVFDRKLGLLTKGDDALESKTRALATEIIRKAACDGGVLDEAAKNGRDQLTALLKTLGFAEVTITIPAGTCS